MKKLLAATITGTMVAALALTGTAASAETRAEKNEARLAKMLEGREAGEATSCIHAFRSNKLRVIDNVGIVYKAGKTIWVARAKNPNSLGWNDVPVIERSGSRLCNNDVIRTIDRSAGFVTGVVFLEKFVPYTKKG